MASNDWIDIRDTGAACDGVTDDTAAVTMALTAAVLAGGGEVRVPGGGRTTVCAGALTLRSRVLVRLGQGATLAYTGAGDFITCDGLTPVVAGGLVGDVGSTVDLGTTGGTGFHLISLQFCRIGGFLVRSNNPANTVFRLTTAGPVPARGSSANLVYTTFAPMLVLGPCGDGMVVNGYDATRTRHTPVTLNRIEDLTFDNVARHGIWLQQDADDNLFQQVRVRLQANDSTGIEHGQAAATTRANESVYANPMDYVAVAAFGAFTGRAGIVFNAGTKANTVGEYYNNPVCDRGAVVDLGDHSQEIREVDTNAITYLRKNVL